jgi:hypothetical protein
MDLFDRRNLKLFNTPLELGLRALFVLKYLYPRSADIHKLIYFDYLLIHSGDVLEGPTSLHPPKPFRSAEILVKKEILEKGLELMISKELIKVVFDAKGITYQATEMTNPFLSYHESNYSKRIDYNAKWLVEEFGNYGEEELNQFMSENIEKWGGEFTRESLFRGENYE